MIHVYNFSISKTKLNTVNRLNSVIKLKVKTKKVSFDFRYASY